MVTPETSVISISGVPIMVSDVLNALDENNAFKSAVRMKALDPTVAELTTLLRFKGLI